MLLLLDASGKEPPPIKNSDRLTSSHVEDANRPPDFVSERFD